jgi:hypothetical protein
MFLRDEMRFGGMQRSPSRDDEASCGCGLPEDEASGAELRFDRLLSPSSTNNPVICPQENNDNSSRAGACLRIRESHLPAIPELQILRRLRDGRAPNLSGAML